MNNSSKREGAGHPLNFEKFASEGNAFILSIADELGVGRNRAARITRALLHALRDRVPADDAVEFAQGLPMALKAVFLDQYDISDTPVVIRNRDDFLGFIYDKAGRTAAADFAEPGSVEKALQGFFRVLYEYMDRHQVLALKRLLGKDIGMLIDRGMPYTNFVL
ncbi:MAG TPA: DUF2267 domain-containing protein [Flavobacteriales bacterium]|nr:DUF2267 domain-containing protein [Flavobacteriales bacterium]